MIQKYLQIAWRNLLKYKSYSLINVLGLAFGIACCLLILLYVADERSYDRAWPQGDRIWRMSLERIYPDRRTGYAIVPPSYAQSVKNDCPEVEEVVRVADFSGGAAVQFRQGNNVFEETKLLGADSTFFKVFQIPLIHGNPDKCLTDPDGVVMTESTARRYFGKTDVVGQTIQLPGNPKPRQLAVTAVCADMPENVHFSFNILMATKGARFLEGTNHISFAAHTYFLLHPGADPAKLEARFPGLVEKYAAGEIQRNFGVSWPEYKAAGNGYRYYLTALPDIHLHSNLEAELKPAGSAVMISIFTVIACFILLIACINFMNLATARSAERAREVGVRKALGSHRSQLAAQFLTEAVLVSAIAALLALGLVNLLLPPFNDLADKKLNLGEHINGLTIAGFLLLTVGTGLLAGSYPAGVLSGFRPIEVLKGRFNAQKKGVLLRNGLVVFQFSISVAMIISTLVVFSQLNYISNKKLGFNKENVVVVQNAFALGPKTEAFKQELTKIAGVESTGGTSEAPGGLNFFGMSFKKQEDNEPVTGRGVFVDDQYLQTLQTEITAGRPFSKEYSDSLSVVLNERAAKDLALGPDPIGKRIVLPGGINGEEGADATFTVVGVVRDFHFQSLHEPIVPLFLLSHKVNQGFINVLTLRVQPGRTQAVLAEVENRWRSFVPDQPFHFTFLDANLAALYTSEKRTQRIFGLFALLAVFIACIGLLGLAAYMTRQRTKEIGIRKVLGAGTGIIVGLLAKDFMRLVLVAILLASPLAAWAMHRWLAEFAYRISLSWWMFALAGLLAAGVAFFTVSFQSFKAALADPVKSLRSE
ncbi:MAG: ABC transporter permease [Saprospiraceae bacterium]|nr:ABC transporter permease [Saprospiraceae bacterium]